MSDSARKTRPFSQVDHIEADRKFHTDSSRPDPQCTILANSDKIRRNGLLSVLPPVEYSRLLPALKPVNLKRGTVLYCANDVLTDCYFPLSSVISLFSTTEDDKTVEVMMVGSEGMIGVPVFLLRNIMPYEAIVQNDSQALRIKSNILVRHFNESAAFRSLLLHYIDLQLCEFSQSIICNSFHTVKQRFCSWLLTVRDKMQSRTFFSTQEFISQILGTPRTNIAMTIKTLEDLRIIIYKRGSITIINRNELRKNACECYEFKKRTSRSSL